MPVLGIKSGQNSEWEPNAANFLAVFENMAWNREWQRWRGPAVIYPRWLTALETQPIEKRTCPSVCPSEAAWRTAESLVINFTLGTRLILIIVENKNVGWNRRKIMDISPDGFHFRGLRIKKKNLKTYVYSITFFFKAHFPKNLVVFDTIKWKDFNPSRLLSSAYISQRFRESLC
jgi:hypothetical protein